MSIDTLSKLAAIDSLEAAQLPEDSDLHAICRKLDIGKRLFSAYGEDWKPQKSVTECDADSYLYVADCFHALAVKLRAIGDESGMDFKLINSAFKALDCAGRNGADAAGRRESLRSLLWGTEG